MLIQKIRDLLNNNSILWTSHCLEKMGERDIKIADVKNCINNGQIIEEYHDDFPKPSCLIFGTAIKGNILHVVVGYDDECLFIITAYYPTTDVFEDDLKTRRR